MERGARETAALESLRRSVGDLSEAAIDAFGQLPWFSSLPAWTRSWVRLVLTNELTTMTEDLAVPRSPVLRGIFSDAPDDVTRELSLAHTVELIRLTVDVVLSAIDDVMDDDDASLLRSDLERYGREAAFAAAKVYAKAAENRGRASAQRQTLFIDALVGGVEHEIADRAAGLIPIDLAVRVLGIAPLADTIDAVLPELFRIARARRRAACAAQHGQSVLAVVPADAGDVLSDLADTVAGRRTDRPTDALGLIRAIVASDVVETVTRAGPAAHAVLFGLRAVAAWPGPPGLIAADDLLPERILCGDEQAASQLVAQCYTPLASAGRGLLETVDALLLHDGSPEAAARSIPVHVNTLRYRLDRVIRLTGRDPRRGRDGYALRMAFALARAGMVTLPPGLPADG